MSGIATLGVLASVTQLAAYSIKIVLHLDEIYAAFQNTSDRTKGHFKQIKELIEITLLIKQQENLWSPAVYRQLQATLSEAQILYDLLRQLSGKYSQNTIWKYWFILSHVAENQIQSSLDNLERQKSTLRLCIDTVHTDLLLSIKGSIDTFSSAEMSKLTKQKNTSALQKSASNPNAGQIPPQQQPLPVSNGTGTTDSSPSQGQRNIGYPTTQEQQKLTSVQESSTSTSNVTSAGHFYSNISSNQNTFQHAGDQNAQAATVQESSTSTSKVTSVGHTYDGLSFHGDGDTRLHVGDQNGTNDQPATIAATKCHTYQNVRFEGQGKQHLGNMNSDAAVQAYWKSQKDKQG